MRLFIAEKPSVGREISKYLPGKGITKDGYIDHGDDVVTWAFGHMLEQAQPGDYDEKYQRWMMQDLPIVPESWKLLITKSSAKQFRVIKDLLDRATTIVHAGDPDREGQLLIDEILDYYDINKPVERILVNALDEKSIKEALADLRSNKDFFPLSQSALARSRADWLMGMNLSRAFTISARWKGHKVTFPIGRVKTPTLALVVRREEELENFKPLTYYTLQGLYEHANGFIKATWQPQDTQAGMDADGHVLRKDVVEELIKKLEAQPIGKILEQEKKKKKEPQRLPLSLSSLQVLAGKAFGYDPQTVLETAQSLYEKKFTTYPRSDCEYLPTSQFKDGPKILGNLSTLIDIELGAMADGADSSIQSRAWNDKNITAHHAIIPTTVLVNWASLSEKEKNVYSIIARAYIAQFYEVHEYNQTKITIEHEGESFVAHGKVVTKLGWKALYQRKTATTADDDDSEDQDDSGALPVVKKGDTVTEKECTLQEKTTKPPSRFTASTLLQAMKEIYKYVRLDEVKKQLKAVSGIGTEATRATIINDLIVRGFMTEEGKKKVLKPTKEGYLLIHAMPDELSYPDETAFWEERLHQISLGEDKMEDFLKDQIAFLTKLVNDVKGKSSTRTTSEYGSNQHMENTVRTVKRSTMQQGQQQRGKLPMLFQTAEKRSSTEMAEEIAAGNYPCPRCKTGHFEKIEERGRTSWRCNNHPNCNTKCADVEGKPSLYVGK